MKTLIISEQYIKDNSLISDNVDFATLRPLIYAIQDTKLKEVLGSKLTALLLLETSTDPDTLSVDNKILCDDYVLPFLNWHLMAARCRIGNTNLYAAGTMENRTTNSDAKDNVVQEEKYYLNFATSYERDMILFLQANLTKYPTYSTNTEINEVQPVKTANDAGGLFLSDNYTVPRY
jgi:hypothetical protein